MRRGLVVLTLLALVAVAAALRLSRLDEMEYKADEQWMYEQSVSLAAHHTWPLLGMRSSAGLPNPALSVMVFAALARIPGVRSPIDLDAAVVWMNVVALALVFFVAAPIVGERDAAAWRWGGALAAVSPFAILLQRKIWAQCVLPLFSVMFLVAWSCRHRRTGAFAWGLLAAILGQIHMSGFFFAAGFVLWELWAVRQGDSQPATRWRAFATGAAIGSVGVVAWVVATLLTMVGPAVAGAHALGPSASGTGVRVFGLTLTPAAVAGWAFGRGTWVDFHILSLWPSHWTNWLFDASGFGLEYSLGTEYGAFLRGPLLGGVPTFIALLATLVSLGLSLRVVVPWALHVWRDFREGRLRSRLLRAGNTSRAVAASLAVFAVLLTATGFTAHRHYLIVAFPLPWVWLAQLTLRRRHGRALLAAMWVAQLIVSLTFLGYVHQHHGAPGGDYGVGYRWQADAGASNREPLLSR